MFGVSVFKAWKGLFDDACGLPPSYVRVGAPGRHGHGGGRESRMWSQVRRTPTARLLSPAGGGNRQAGRTGSSAAAPCARAATTCITVFTGPCPRACDEPD